MGSASSSGICLVYWRPLFFALRMQQKIVHREVLPEDVQELVYLVGPAVEMDSPAHLTLVTPERRKQWCKLLRRSINQSINIEKTPLGLL